MAAPFTGRSLEGGGMLTQVIAARDGARQGGGQGPLRLRRVMGQRLVGTPQSAVADARVRRRLSLGRARIATASISSRTSEFRCQRFFFSEPIYEVITGLFVQAKLAFQVAPQ